MSKVPITDRERAKHILKEPRSREDFHLIIAPWIEELVKGIGKESLGYQKDAQGKNAYAILQCIVEWRDGATSTVWLKWDVDIPTCYEDHFNFLFEQPRVDVPYKG